MRRERPRDRFPLFYAFGESHFRLSEEEAKSAPMADRIRSVWPFLVQRVIAFEETLRPRERANFDAEDTLTEVWIELARKDSKWDPARGKYITFAGKLLRNRLDAIRDESRTVQSPPNSGCRLREYRRAEAEGTLTGRQAKTAVALKRSRGMPEPIDDHDEQYGEADDAIEVAERRSLSRSAVIDALRTLRPIEAAVIGRAYGLWGQPRQSIEEIATATKRTPEAIRRTKSRAQARIRERLRDQPNLN